MKASVRRSLPLLTRQLSGRAETPDRFKIGRHQRRAGFGVWAFSTTNYDRSAIKAWKLTQPFSPDGTRRFVEGLVSLVRLWAPVLPEGLVLTTPPQGASAPGPYPASYLVTLVGLELGVPFVPLLSRTDQKPRHGIQCSLGQAPYFASVPNTRPALVVVCDDLATSGRTMQLSLAALHQAGLPAFGLVYSGV